MAKLWRDLKLKNKIPTVTLYHIELLCPFHAKENYPGKKHCVDNLHTINSNHVCHSQASISLDVNVDEVCP